MFGKNRNKKVGLCVMVVTASLVLAGLWAVLATPETALAHKTDSKHHGKDKDDDGEGFAQVTISGPIVDGEVLPGPMETNGPETFPIKESKKTLELNRGVWTELGAVPIRYSFANTVNNCYCKEDALCVLLDGHLVDPDDLDGNPTFPERWGVKIRIDMSSLKNVGDSSETNSNDHFIDITTEFTDPTEYYVTLWIPEGPRGPNSGLVTVKWVYDSEADPMYTDEGKRVRIFEFTSDKLQVWTKEGGEYEILRCANPDPIYVTVVTAP